MRILVKLAVLAMVLVAVGIGRAAFAETVLITGANSGIGLEFARQYAADGWEVIATHRRSSTPDSLASLSARYDNVRVERIDVTDMSTIYDVVERLDGKPIDIIVNNAGIVGELTDPGQQFGSLDFEAMQQFIDINALGPLRVSEAFYDNVVASEQRKIVAISSISGSIGTRYKHLAGPVNGPPARYWYDASKAALNMGFVALATDAIDDGVSVAVYHPGLVLVERTRKYGLPEHFFTSVEDSVAGLRVRFEELTPKSTGRFYDNLGESMPW